MGRDLNGDWNGRYAYSVPVPGDPEASAVQVEDMNRRVPVEFVMSIREGFLFSIRGTVNDLGPGAVKGESVLAGWKLGRRIRFTKTYPTRFKVMVAVDGVAKPLNDVLNDLVGAEAAANFVLPSHQVHYGGLIQPDGSTIEGTWEIRNSSVRIPPSGKYLRLKLRTLGTWTATRST